MSNQQKIINLLKGIKEHPYYKYPLVDDGFEFTEESWYIQLCLIQKWLRDKHNLIVASVCYGCNDSIVYRWEVYNINLNNFIESRFIYNYNTYEEALEEGIIKAVKLIDND